MIDTMATAPPDAPDLDPTRRFGGIERLYGAAALARLAHARVAVVGIGGVGSWAAEALARSGVGGMRLIDLDHVAESNINRQIHALDATLGMAKVEAMKQRIAQINPQLEVEAVDDFLDPSNASELTRGCDFVVDAIDQVKAKVSLIVACREVGIPLVCAGGAGGKRDPGRIRLDDLSRTAQDPLLAKVRSILRREHGFPRDLRRRFGIEAIYSDEAPAITNPACPDARPASGLSCAGYGSSVMVTASVGFHAAARAIEGLLRR